MNKSLFKSHLHVMGKLKPAKKLCLEELEKIIFEE